MAALREKSERLTGYLETLIRERLSDTLQLATPREPERRGAQPSLRVVRGHGLAGRNAGRSLFDFLATQGVLGDCREPDVQHRQRVESGKRVSVRVDLGGRRHIK